MTTYRITVEGTADCPCQAMAYSTATNAIDDLDGLRAGGATVSTIMRDGQTIDEAALRAEEAGSTVCIE